MDRLSTLRNRFVYTSDAGRDRWRIMSEFGPLHGDCEDFALTAIYLMCDRSMWRFWWMVLTFRAVLWYCKSARGEGHACLWFKGYGWIDNIYPQWSNTARHSLRFPYLGPFLALGFLIKGGRNA